MTPRPFAGDLALAEKRLAPARKVTVWHTPLVVYNLGVEAAYRRRVAAGQAAGHPHVALIGPLVFARDPAHLETAERM